jgi:hypothetical protein
MEQDCTYQRLDNGLHEFSFHQPTNTAVDEWLAQTTTILEQQPRHEPYRAILVLLTGGLLPLNYFMTQVRAWQKGHPAYRTGRIAIIYQSGLFLGVGETVTDLLTRQSNLAIRFFSPSRRAEAINWLMKK